MKGNLYDWIWNFEKTQQKGNNNTFLQLPSEWFLDPNSSLWCFRSYSQPLCTPRMLGSILSKMASKCQNEIFPILQSLLQSWNRCFNTSYRPIGMCLMLEIKWCVKKKKKMPCCVKNLKKLKFWTMILGKGVCKLLKMILIVPKDQIWHVWNLVWMVLVMVHEMASCMPIWTLMILVKR